MRYMIPALIIANMWALAFSFGHRSAPPSSIPARPVWQQVEMTMNACGITEFTGAHHLLAKQVARICEDVFQGDRKATENFIALLCIESQFNPLARSKVGALGISQVMPQYVAEFAKECDIPGSFKSEDLLNPEIGIRIGACRFRSLTHTFEGNTALALAGYNSGAGSITTRKLAKGGNGAEETNGYLARFLVVMEKLR